MAITLSPPTHLLQLGSISDPNSCSELAITEWQVQYEGCGARAGLPATLLQLSLTM